MFDDRIGEDASADFAPKDAPAENPFRPISVADRLKGAPKRPTHAHAPVQPMRPGQLYGVTHEPEPVKENPYAPPVWTPPAQSVDAATSAFEPLAPPAPFPSAYDAPAAPAYADAHTQTHSTADLPPYLKKRPSLTPHSAAEKPAPKQEAETAGDAPGGQFVSFHDYVSPTTGSHEATAPYATQPYAPQAQAAPQTEQAAPYAPKIKFAPPMHTAPPAPSFAGDADENHTAAVSHEAEQAPKRRSRRAERDTLATPEGTPQAAYEAPYGAASGDPYAAPSEPASSDPYTAPYEPSYTASNNAQHSAPYTAAYEASYTAPQGAASGDPYTAPQDPYTALQGTAASGDPYTAPQAPYTAPQAPYTPPSEPASNDPYTVPQDPYTVPQDPYTAPQGAESGDPYTAPYTSPYEPAYTTPNTTQYSAPYTAANSALYAPGAPYAPPSIPQSAAPEPPSTPAKPDFTARPEWLTPPARTELPLYTPPIEFDPYAMQEADVPYQPTQNGELPYMPAQDSQQWEPAEAPYLQEQEPSPEEPFVTDEIASFLGEGYSAPVAGISQAEVAPLYEPEQPAPYVADEQPVWKDPFAPAAGYQEGQEASAPPQAATDAPKPKKPHPQKKPSKPKSQKPPVRPWRVISLVAAVAMLAFCGIAGGRIVFNLATNEREMEAVRNEYLQSQGVPLEAAGARVELLPPGQTFEPTVTPVAVETPSPEPLIAVVQSNTDDPNQAIDGTLQEGAEVTPTPPARTVAERYEKNPLRNTMESMRALSEEYTDVVGRLTIDGVLNEVVVSRNNTYYLTHNYRGTTSDAGAVFVDESCTIERPPENLLLRGQSAIEGKVFAPLWQYQTGGREFVASHTNATLTTLYEEERYVLFAVIVADSDPSSSGYFNYASHPTFATDESMLSYVQSARAHSLYEFTLDVAATDRLLTLATLGTDNRCLVLIFRML